MIPPASSGLPRSRAFSINGLYQLVGSISGWKHHETSFLDFLPCLECNFRGNPLQKPWDMPGCKTSCWYGSGEARWRGRPMSRAEYRWTFPKWTTAHDDRKWSTCSWFIWFIWLVDWNINFLFPYIRKNHPNWLIFFRGVESTNWLFMDNGKMVHLRQHCSQDLGRALGEARKAAGAAQVRLVEFCQLLQVLRNSSACDLCGFIIWYHMVYLCLSGNMAPGLSSFSPHLRMVWATAFFSCA